ncbi:DUF456 domain-containing protein [Paenibacillus xylanivorans]|uniref:Uncharacterized protein n=1 Tax=Paenibacillus xylanivorans TaxID=1705561 RepID=A0A0M9BPI7_9BACL|nr:DUF456 domain-containing protein [Paenibacillus xylanivorans]KOY16383.1 hypothetical protein AMS66_10965 [Paenibacillus xylanivorans]
MYIILVLVVGIVLCLLVPFGPILAGAIVFALIADNYRQTMNMREDIRAIKNHLGLMNKGEAEEYKIDRQLTDVKHLDSDQLKVINRRIEAELEKESRNNKS